MIRANISCFVVRILVQLVSCPQPMAWLWLGVNKFIYLYIYTLVESLFLKCSLQISICYYIVSGCP